MSKVSPTDAVRALRRALISIRVASIVDRSERASAASGSPMAVDARARPHDEGDFAGMRTHDMRASTAAPAIT
jgi:hypothetical protein